jgi:hypothetical protein
MNSHFAFFSRLFGLNLPAGDELLQPVSPRVLVINYDPVVDAQGTRLAARMGWNPIDDLIPGFIADMRGVSYGLVNYQVDGVHRIDVDEFPSKADGFQSTAASYFLSSSCDDWLTFPARRGSRRLINANEWGWGRMGRPSTNGGSACTPRGRQQELNFE